MLTVINSVWVIVRCVIVYFVWTIIKTAWDREKLHIHTLEKTEPDMFMTFIYFLWLFVTPAARENENQPALV